MAASPAIVAFAACLAVSVAVSVACLYLLSKRRHMHPLNGKHPTLLFAFGVLLLALMILEASNLLAFESVPCFVADWVLTLTLIGSLWIAVCRAWILLFSHEITADMLSLRRIQTKAAERAAVSMPSSPLHTVNTMSARREHTATSGTRKEQTITSDKDAAGTEADRKRPPAHALTASTASGALDSGRSHAQGQQGESPGSSPPTTVPMTPHSPVSPLSPIGPALPFAKSGQQPAAQSHAHTPAQPGTGSPAAGVSSSQAAAGHTQAVPDSTAQTGDREDHESPRMRRFDALVGTTGERANVGVAVVAAAHTEWKEGWYACFGWCSCMDFFSSVAFLA